MMLVLPRGGFMCPVLTCRAAMRAARAMRPMTSAPVKPAMARATSYQLMLGSTALFRACTWESKEGEQYVQMLVREWYTMVRC